jgi:hypothetical protein
MPSIHIDENYIVTSIMDFDPIDSTSIYIDSYNPEYVGKKYTDGFIVEDIDTLKSTRITQIKQEAQSRITALDWRLERAKERAELGITDQETVQDVMQLREQIRMASNQAEIAVNQLTDAGAIQQFQW